MSELLRISVTAYVTNVNDSFEDLILENPGRISSHAGSESVCVIHFRYEERPLSLRLIDQPVAKVCATINCAEFAKSVMGSSVLDA